MEIWFYHLTRHRLDRALPLLLERCGQRGWRCVVQATSDERVTALDEALWTWSEDSFLAHGTARDGDEAMQPVFLTTSDENPNGAAARFFVEGSAITPALAASRQYERLFVLFDGNDEAELQAARGQWSALKALNCELAYWKQNESGGWEKGG